MWARRAKLIAIGLVGLVIGLLLIRLRPERLVVVVAYDTNTAPTSFTVEVMNATRTLHDFTAWTEYNTNGAWMRLTPPRQGPVLKPSEKDVFTLPKPDHGNARVAVSYRQIVTGEWERWINSIKQVVGAYPKSDRMYIVAQ